MVAAWDDHDSGLNDGGASNPYKQTAKAMFNDFFDVPPGDPRRTAGRGTHARWAWGGAGRRVQVREWGACLGGGEGRRSVLWACSSDVVSASPCTQVIVLDTRWYRSELNFSGAPPGTPGHERYEPGANVASLLSPHGDSRLPSLSALFSPISLHLFDFL